jgi:Transposase DDE domain group 1
MSTQTAPKRTQLCFDFLPAKQVVLRPSDGQLTSDAGLLAIRQFDERAGWTARFAACLTDDREAAVHSVASMIRQRVYGILAGYEDCNDHDALRDDPVFKMIAGRLPDEAPLASQPTLSRLENAATPDAILKMIDLTVEQGVKQVQRKHGGTLPRRVTIDLDSTDDPTHGQQQLTFFHGFYDQHQFLPMIVSEPTTKHVFIAWLRHGTAGAALGADDDITCIARAFQRIDPRVRLHVRGDAGIGNPSLYELCENRGHTYTCGLATNSKLKGWAHALMERAKSAYAATGQKQRLFAFLKYRAGTWSRPRTVVAKAECSGQGTNLRFIVTNLPVKNAADAERVYDGYVQRGESEQRMDELKNGLSAGRLSCHRFAANFLRLLLHTLAFNLLNALRDDARVPEELRAARPETLRTRLIKVAARVIQTTRRIVVELSGCWPFWPLLERVGRRALGAAGPRAASP